MFLSKFAVFELLKYFTSSTDLKNFLIDRPVIFCLIKQNELDGVPLNLAESIEDILTNKNEIVDSLDLLWDKQLSDQVENYKETSSSFKALIEKQKIKWRNNTWKDFNTLFLKFFKDRNRADGNISRTDLLNDPQTCRGNKLYFAVYFCKHIRDTNNFKDSDLNDLFHLLDVAYMNLFVTEKNLHRYLEEIKRKLPFYDNIEIQKYSWLQKSSL